MCGMQAGDTVWHRTYECPFVKSKMMEEPRLARLRYLDAPARAERHMEGREAFWNRAVVPSAWYQLGQPPEQQRVEPHGLAMQVQEGAKLDVSGMVCYLDESGGTYTDGPTHQARWVGIGPGDCDG